MSSVPSAIDCLCAPFGLPWSLVLLGFGVVGIVLLNLSECVLRLLPVLADSDMCVMCVDYVCMLGVL